MTIVAHRGLHHHSPENSLGAFAAAAEANIPWVECDIWPSADDAIAVIHDETVDRTTAGTGKVSELRWEQLQRFHMCSLPEVLGWMPIEVGILVEVKPRDDARFVRLALNELIRSGRPWILQSFHAENLIYARAIDPSINCAMLVDAKDQLHSAIDFGWPIIHAEHSLIHHEIVDQLHSAGRKIGAWTVNHPADIQRMIELQIDMLITDQPELATQTLAKLSPETSAAAATDFLNAQP